MIMAASLMHCLAQDKPAANNGAQAAVIEFQFDGSATKGATPKRSILRELSLIELPPQQGVHPLMVSGLKPDLCGKGILSKNDVIVAINGKSLQKDPLEQFNTACKEAISGPGLLWLSRWREGEVSRVMLDLGIKPMDLTRRPVPGRGHDWRLGPMAANGWVFCKLTRYGASQDARQILITQVDEGGPSDGKLKPNDVIVGAYGEIFEVDARKAIAAAINRAESEKEKGVLKLQVWRAGKSHQVEVRLPVMGTYSETMPYDCEKTDRIIKQTSDYLLTQALSNRSKLNGSGNYRESFVGYINALGLMATGRKDVMPKVQEFAYALCIPSDDIPVKHRDLCSPGTTLSLEKHTPMVVWDWAYRTIVLCEYHLLTQDPKVLPTIREYATKLAMGQSGAGSWGQTFAAIENTGYLHGHLGGYGALNQNTINAGLALLLAKRCGVVNQEIKDAIKRTDHYFSFYIGKGALPYGDHTPGFDAFTSNGKSGGAAVFFDVAGNEEGARFFNALSMGHAVTGREAGHGGHFFSHLWGGIGAARGGKLVLHNFFDEMNFLFTLERQPDGRMVNQLEAGEGNQIGDLKKFQDFSGQRLLQLCAPRKVIFLTGKGTPDRQWMTQERIDRVFDSGRLMYDKAARSQLSKGQILILLQDELPAIRGVGISALEEQGLNLVPDLLSLLDSESRFARAGAAQALGTNGYNSKEAVAKLIEIVESDSDLLCRMHAVRAFTASDEESGLLNVSEPAIPSLLKLATKRWDSDPNQKLQVEIAVALFNTYSYIGRPGLCAKYGISESSRPLFAPALKVLLTNPNGSARGWASHWSYQELTAAEMELLWPEIYLATRFKGPSCVMWSNKVMEDGLKLMAKHHITEGLELLVEKASHRGLYATSAKLIPSYGSHAKPYLPELREIAEKYADSKRKNEIKMHKAIQQLIGKVESMPAQSDFELISIADYIKGARNPYVPN